MSLAGAVAPGSTVDAEFGIYACEPAKRGDIVLYRFAGNPVPVIKIVKGVPGDHFALSTELGLSTLLINDGVAKNAQGASYVIAPSERRMLELYVNDNRKGGYFAVIPADTYLLLGNQAAGSIDSRRFGLVARGDLLARVTLP